MTDKLFALLLAKDLFKMKYLISEFLTEHHYLFPGKLFALYSSFGKNTRS